MKMLAGALLLVFVSGCCAVGVECRGKILKVPCVKNCCDD